MRLTENTIVRDANVREKLFLANIQKRELEKKRASKKILFFSYRCGDVTCPGKGGYKFEVKRKDKEIQRNGRVVVAWPL